MSFSWQTDIVQEVLTELKTAFYCISLFSIFDYFQLTKVCMMCSFQETFSYRDLPRPTLDSMVFFWKAQLNINTLTRNNNVTAREL